MKTTNSTNSTNSASLETYDYNREVLFDTIILFFNPYCVVIFVFIFCIIIFSTGVSMYFCGTELFSSISSSIKYNEIEMADIELGDVPAKLETS